MNKKPTKMNVFQRVLFEGIFKERYKNRTLVKLSKDMKVRDAMESVLDYSSRSGTECGFIFDDYEDEVWYFIEGNAEGIAVGKAKYDFHTHPSEIEECLPSIEDLMRQVTGTVVIGCPKLGKMISVKRGGKCWNREIKVNLKRAETALKNYEVWKNDWKKRRAIAEKRQQYEKMESLDYEAIQEEGNFRSFMNLLEMETNKALKKCNLVREIR